MARRLRAHMHLLARLSARGRARRPPSGGPTFLSRTCRKRACLREERQNTLPRMEQTVQPLDHRSLFFVGDGLVPSRAGLPSQASKTGRDKPVPYELLPRQRLGVLGGVETPKARPPTLPGCAAGSTQRSGRLRVRTASPCGRRSRRSRRDASESLGTSYRRLGGPPTMAQPCASRWQPKWCSKP